VSNERKYALLPAKGGGTVTILIVDDEYYITQGIVENIKWEKIGIDKVVCAYSMQQAQNALLQQSTDILLADIEMPHGSGLDLILWTNEHNMDPVRILLTGHKDFEYAQTALRLGCYEYLTKPVDYQKLEKVLEKAVSRCNSDKNLNMAKNIAETLDIKDISLLEHIVKENREEMPGGDSKTMSEQVKHYIKEHISDETLNRAVIADVFHLSPEYLSALFHKQQGEVLNNYITRKRVDAAKKILDSTDMPLQTIADNTGFSTSSYFHKQFKKLTGLTPMQYRTKKGKKRDKN
jgi:YesN/AraC family two-component response regulator